MMITMMNVNKMTCREIMVVFANEMTCREGMDRRLSTRLCLHATQETQLFTASGCLPVEFVYGYTNTEHTLHT